MIPIEKVPYLYNVYSTQTAMETGVFDQFGIAYQYVKGYHCVFAAELVPQPYEIIQQTILGWTARDLLDEVLDRQGRFITSLHNVDTYAAPLNLDLRTVSLRYIVHPSEKQIHTILVGKVFSQDPEQAHRLALAWYKEIVTLLPPDYALRPFETEEAFFLRSGQRLLEKKQPPAPTAEVRRYERFLSRPSEQDVLETHYVVYPFLWHRNAMDQVWWAMGRETTETILSITVRPVYLYEAEEIHLLRFYEAANALLKSQHPAENILGMQATEIYAGYLRSWTHPFLLRIQITAPQEIPSAVVRALGCAFSYSTPVGGGMGERPFVGYEVVTPEEEEWAVAHTNGYLLEMDGWGPTQAAVPYQRFRYLTDWKGAHSIFRFPVALKKTQ